MRIPDFKTSDEVDAWTTGVGRKKDLGALAVERDKSYAISKRFMAKHDTKNALKYGQRGAFYREAIENITGLHDVLIRRKNGNTNIQCKGATR